MKTKQKKTDFYHLYRRQFSEKHDAVFCLFTICLQNFLFVGDSFSFVWCNALKIGETMTKRLCICSISYVNMGKNCKIYKKINKSYCKLSAIVIVYQVVNLKNLYFEVNIMSM